MCRQLPALGDNVKLAFLSVYLCESVSAPQIILKGGRELYKRLKILVGPSESGDKIKRGLH